MDMIMHNKKMIMKITDGSRLKTGWFLEIFYGVVLMASILGITVSTGFGQNTGTAFSILPAKNSQVNWRGSTLIESDYISYFDNEDFNRRATGFESIKDGENWIVNNCWSDQADLPFRKELGISPDGNIVELTVQFTQPAYKNRTDVDLYYSFRIPLKAVVNMNWTATVDRVFRPRKVSGILKDDSPEDFIDEKIRWLAFSGNGKKLVFDFNPEGMQTYSDDGINNIQGLWSVHKKGDYLECSFGFHSSLYGGTLNSKVVVFEGEYSDYPKRHAYDFYSYYFDLPVNRTYCFGAPEHDDQFVQAGDSIYNDKRGFGWLDSSIKLHTLRTSGALYSAAYGNKSAIFKSHIARKGLYLITARIGTGKKPAGPLSMTCSGNNIISDISVAPHTAQTITWSQWLEKGKVEFKFEGDWRISTIALQMLQHTHEDYKFRRGFWRVGGLYEPSVVFRSSYFEKPPLMETSISSAPLPANILHDIDKAIISPEGKISLPDQQSQEMAWRFNANIGSLGPDNSGNFDEFNTQELLERRFTELRDKNINTIILNGFLSRHTFPNHQERIKKMIPLIVKEAHRQGIKVIDHMDLILLWNMGSGFRVLTEHPDWLQRTVADNVPGTFFCPVNPKFKQQFFDWMIQHIKATHIDGFMIDEQTFGGVSYCGCSSCRKQFHDATGLTLPMDETSPMLKNRESKLWQSWLKWRIQVLGDRVVELKELTKEINPNLTFMRYTTHYGFTSDYAPIRFGTSLTESARACDFLGTEIMSRNIYASYRSVFSYRKLKYSLREAYGSPLFGLVYSLQSPEVSYFGWSINNMNNQGSWLMNDIPENATTPVFTAFNENMNRQLARPITPVAMLFSTQSRDWSQDESYYVDPFGFGEAMNDLHYQYTTLIEPSLKPDKLKQYKTIILPDARCLSDTQIDILLKFADHGGKLLLTARTGMFDAIGNQRTSWPFAEILGINNPLPAKFIKGGRLSLDIAGKSVENKMSSIEISLNGTKEITEFMTLQASNGKEYPAGITVPYGRGSISYISSQIGGLNVEDERTHKQEWTFEWNQEAFKFQEALFQQLFGDDCTFKPVNIPYKVLTTVYSQIHDEKKYTLVHLLNATGSSMKKGQIVPKGVPEQPFPELPEDLKFNIELSELKNVFITSPNFSGRKPITMREMTNGWYEITVPKMLLKCYSIVWLEN